MILLRLENFRHYTRFTGNLPLFSCKSSSKPLDNALSVKYQQKGMVAPGEDNQKSGYGLRLVLAVASARHGSSGQGCLG